jgi:hypothetical protein
MHRYLRLAVGDLKLPVMSIPQPGWYLKLKNNDRFIIKLWGKIKLMNGPQHRDR